MEPRGLKINSSGNHRPTYANRTSVAVSPLCQRQVVMIEALLAGGVYIGGGAVLLILIIVILVLVLR